MEQDVTITVKVNHPQNTNIIIVPDTQCPAINPPGKIVYTDTKIISANSLQQITFPGTAKLHPRPLPPLVQAQSGVDNSIIVNAVFFVHSDYKIENNQFNVYWDGNILKPSFYISFTKITNVLEKNIFNTYAINFELDGTNLKKEHLPTEIEVFLWDCDPKLSRGTVTTVQST